MQKDTWHPAGRVPGENRWRQAQGDALRCQPPQQTRRTNGGPACTAQARGNLSAVPVPACPDAAGKEQQCNGVAVCPHGQAAVLFAPSPDALFSQAWLAESAPAFRRACISLVVRLPAARGRCSVPQTAEGFSPVPSRQGSTLLQTLLRPRTQNRRRQTAGCSCAYAQEATQSCLCAASRPDPLFAEGFRHSPRPPGL